MKTVPHIDSDPTAAAPISPTDFQRILAEKDQAIAQRDAQLTEREALIARQQQLLRLMEEELRLARLRKFGARSEKLPFQGELFDEAELEVSLSEIERQVDEAEDTAGQPKPRKPRRRKANGFDENLPRIQVHLALDAEEKAGASKTFYTKVKEELDIVPAQARVIEYWQEKAVFDTEDGGQQVKAAPRPVHPLGKCLASTDLLAWVLTAKYADARPLYRLEGILQRHGGRLSRASVANWIIRLTSVFQPLIHLLREQQLAHDDLQADETRPQVLKETGKSAQSDKWMWVIRGGPPDKQIVLFGYDRSRSEEVPRRLLEGFCGVRQTDGYAGYNRVNRASPASAAGIMHGASSSRPSAPRRPGRRASG